jgi:sugar phosphate isomerase/epimerase
VNDMTDSAISLQLYSLRDAGELAVQLSLAVAGGFTAVEPYGRQLIGGPDLSGMLKARGLVAPSAHVSVEALLEDPEAVFAAAHAAGTTLVVLPAPPMDLRLGRRDAWLAFAQRLGQLAERAGGVGLTLGYHNHHWECLECEDGRTGLEILIDETERSNLVFELDPAWILRARQDPLAILARAAGRVAAVHVKDIAPRGEAISEDGWAVPGQGTVDWPGLIGAARAAGARLFVAEHDNPSDPAGYAGAARIALERLVGGLS